MDFRKYLRKLIENGKLKSFSKGFRRKMRSIKKLFKGEIPSSYKIFLEEVGHGMINGWEFNGIGLARHSSFAKKVKLWHDTDPYLPKNYLLISEVGSEITWYFDISKRYDNGECPIVGWIGGLNQKDQPEWLKEQEFYKSFEEYFKAKAEN